jgi:hypothetical protein
LIPVFGTLVFLLTIFKVFEYRAVTSPGKPLKKCVERATGYKINGRVRRLAYGTIRIDGDVRGKFFGGRRTVKNTTLLLAADGTTKFIGGVKLGPTPSAVAKQNIKKDWKKLVGVATVVICLVIVSHVWAVGFISVVGFGVARVYGAGSGPYDGLWSTAVNWTGDTVPQAGDVVTLNGTRNAALSVDVDTAALASFTIAAGYTNTCTVNFAQTGTKGTLAILSGNYNTNGFTEVAGVVTVAGSSYITCGASSITITSINVSTTTAYLVMNTSQWSVGGNWSSSSTSASYNVGTSTVTFTANATITSGWGVDAHVWFYNTIINTGVTIDNMNVSNQLTLNGTATITTCAILYRGTNANPLVLSGSETLTNCFIQYNTINAVYNVPANLSCKTLHTWSAWGGTCQGTVTVGSGGWYHRQGNMNFNGNTINVTTGELKWDSGYGGTGFSCGAATVNVKDVTCQISASNYIVMNSSTWNVTGNWTNMSTSASWNCGTSTINFNGGAAQAVYLNNGNSANIQYYNLIFSNGSAATVALGANNIRCNGTLTISSTTCTVSETVNNPTWSIYGSITKANGSTWNRGTGLMTVNAACSITDNGVAKTDLKSVTIQGAIQVIFVTANMTTLIGNNAGGSILLSGACKLTNSIVSSSIGGPSAPGFYIAKSGGGGSLVKL